MLRRRRPWWTMFAAATLVMATLLAPIEGAAYRITNGGDPVDRGDPDDPSGGPAKNSRPELGKAQMVTLVVIQPIPGVFVRVPIPVRFSPVINFSALRKSLR